MAANTLLSRLLTMPLPGSMTALGSLWAVQRRGEVWPEAEKRPPGPVAGKIVAPVAHRREFCLS
jgi:hypothetical protein